MRSGARARLPERAGDTERDWPGGGPERGAPWTTTMALEYSGRPAVKSRLFQFLCLVFLPALIGCPMLNEAEGEGVVSVGSRTVGIDELKRDMAFVSPGLEPSMFQTADALAPLLDRVIERYLIMEYSEKSGISVTDGELAEALRRFEGKEADGVFEEALLKEYVAVREWKEKLRERLVVEKVLTRVMADVPPPSYQEIKAHFEANRRAYHLPEMVQFRQIVTPTREEAETLLDRLRRGEDMGELARRFSAAPEADSGGVVGWIARGELHESMEGPLFTSQAGERTSVIKTPYGYHIFEVLAHRPEEKRDLPEVFGEIESELLARKRDAYLDQWLKGLKDRIQVSVDYEKLKDVGFMLNES